MLAKILPLSFLFCTIFASHFRGGTYSWQVVQAPDGTNDLVIDYRLAWRNSMGPAYYCDEQIKNNGTIIAGEGNLQCLSGCSTNIGALKLRCTDYSPASKEDWTSGVNVMSMKITPSLSKLLVVG